jgi:hypothetical protein
MSNKTKYIVVVILILSGLIGYRFLTYPIGLTSDDFKNVYKSGDAATQENYSTQCQAEFDSNLLFPLGQVSKAVFCKGFFSFDRTLSTDKTKRLIEILNDTASYVWGEVGTFIPDRAIVFYDKEGKPLGITELEEEGGRQSYSFPYLRRTKWGALTDNAMNEINTLTTE